MSQATLPTDILAFNAAADTESALPAARSSRFFAIRSSTLTLLACGAVAIAGAAGIARLSDTIVDSNASASAAAAAVPPAEYYQYITSNGGMDAPAAETATAADAPAIQSAVAAD